MKRFKYNKKIKISKLLILICSLIFFLTILIFNCYSNKTSDKIIELTKMKLNKFTDSFLSNNIGYNVIKDKDLDKLLIVNKNKDGEILFVDYDIKLSYEILESITNLLNKLIIDLENGKHNITDKNILSSKNGLILKVPMFIGSNSIFLANLGPKIFINNNFIGAILTNIKTKITNYGLNNALVELYVTIEISEEIISPVVKDKNTYKYDVLIASKIINGRVPYIFGDYLESKSNILSIPIGE